MEAAASNRQVRRRVDDLEGSPAHLELDPASGFHELDCPEVPKPRRLGEAVGRLEDLQQREGLDKLLLLAGGKTVTRS
eukprot:12795955-Heterocapsa_arctica.AAC.1